MHFNGKISVTIADMELKTVVSVSTKNDSQQIGADCDIIVPLNCVIQYQNGGKSDYLTQQANVAFKTGDKVVIRAQYEGIDWIDIFYGYISDFFMGTPTTIKCMDYIYHFNLGIFGDKRILYKKNKKSKKAGVQTTGCSFASIKLKELLTRIIDFVNDTIDNMSENSDHIELLEPVMDMTLENLTFAMMSPAAILEWLKKEMGINISLVGNKLYCNIASNTLSSVKYSTDRNVLTSNLQKPNSTFTTYKVKAWFVREDGTKDSYEIGSESGQLREVFFYKVVPRTEENYKKLASDALVKFKQNRYSGTIETLLYPDCDLFWKAEYKDIRYPEKNGNYVITGNDINIDENGYHRTLKFAFLSEIQ
jgi:hypothetical protein